MRLFFAPEKLNRFLILPVMSLALSGCLMEEEVPEAPLVSDSGGATGEILRDHELTGSVGDGPIVGAAVRVRASDGTDLGNMSSDANAGYNITVRTKGKYYPLSIDARGGIDLVTGLAPDFALKSVALEPGKKTVANLNPFSTLAVELAAELPGGLTKENVAIALNRVTTRLNSGLLALAGEAVMTQPIDASTIAEMVKASETLGETIRRKASQHGVEQLAMSLRVVAPALKQPIADQRVADDPPREGMAIRGLLPAARQVPVVGNVVVVEDHVDRQVRERPLHPREPVAKARDHRALGGITRRKLGRQRSRRPGRVQSDHRPQHRRPDQQVHGRHLGQGDQMIVGRGGREDGLFHTAEEDVLQGAIGLCVRQ